MELKQIDVHFQWVWNNLILQLLLILLTFQMTLPEVSFSDHYGKFVLVSKLQFSSIAISATLYHMICAKRG